MGPLFVTVSVYVMVAPAATAVADAACVMERSAPWTVMVFDVSELFPGFGSVVVELIDTVSVIAAPATVSGSTCTINAKVAVLPAGMFAERLQVSVPVAPAATPEQVQVPVPPVRVKDTYVVPAGIVWVTEGVVAALVPLLLITVCVKVICAPVAIGVGAPVLAVT